MSVNLCTPKLFLYGLGVTQSSGSNDPHSSSAWCYSVTHSSKVIESVQSKEAINSVLRWGPLVANEGTFSVPFSHRQEVIVTLQHSRWHGGCVVALHGVWPEQLVVQPAVHCKLEFMVSFFSCKGSCEPKEEQWRVRYMIYDIMPFLICL